MPTYTFTTLNDPSGANGTFPIGINNDGQIVGYFIDSLGVSHGYLYDGSSFKTIDAPSSAAFGGTNLNGINQQDQIAGWYSDGTSFHSFVYDHGTFTAIDDPSAGNNSSGTNRYEGTYAKSINDKGEVVGYYIDGAGVWHGFLDNNGIFTNIDAELGATNVATGINDNGQIIGYYLDSTGYHGFLDNNGVFTNIDAGGFTIPVGINNNGDITGYGGPYGGFLYSNGQFTAVNDPLGYSYNDGINDLGQIVGYASNQGFLASSESTKLPDLTQGLIAYWPFDGSATDASGNGNNLDLYGAAGFAAGQFGQALSLDGTQGTYAGQPTDNTAFDFIGSDFTIQLWVKTAAFTNGAGVAILAEKFSGQSGPGWTLYSYTQNIVFYANGQPILNGALSGTIFTNTWNEVVVERSGSNLHLYFNGNDIADSSYSAQFQGSPNPLLIGARDAEDGRNNDFSGLIDNVAIWNRALTPTEIAQTWNNGAGVQLSAQLPVTPTVAVSIDNININVANPIGLVTFGFSEAPTSFALADTSAVGGTLSNLQQVNATTYTATFTGAANTDINNASVSVTAGSYQDLAGNAGISGSTAPFTVDTVVPTVAVSIDRTIVNLANPNAQVTFTFSKPPVDFSLNDVSATDGTLSNLSGSGTTYTVTFTANPGVDDNAATVSVINGSYHDADGNVGSGGSTISPVKFSSAVATFHETYSSENWAPSQMIDGLFTGPPGLNGDPNGGKNGWAVFNVDTGVSEAANALLTLATPLAAGQYNLTFRIYQNYYGNPGHILGDFALDYTTDASPTLSSPQTHVSIQSASSLNGTTFSSLSPGELLANSSQNSVGTDTYTISASIDSPAPITGIFLDAIKNSALPGGGPGTFDNGNFVVSEFTLDASTDGSTVPFTVDTVTPTVAVSINNTDVNVANSTGTVTFAFSEAPASFTLGDTSAVGGTLSNLQQTDATHYTATFTGAANTDIANASVSVTAGSWQEGNGNPGAGGSTSSFTVDTVTPTVTSIVTSPASGDKNTGTIITLTLTISEIVTVTGTPALTLNDGGTAIYQSGSGSNKLIFTYTVANAQNASALAVTGNNLNGTTVAITDTDGNAANLSGADVTFSGLAIGATVTSITANPPSGDLGPGKTVTFTVTMSEAVKLAGVTSSTTPFLTLNDGGTATYKSGSGTNVLTFTYTVGVLGAGQNASTLGVTGFNPNGATVYNSNVTADTANLSGVTSFTGGPQIDTIAPTVSSVAASGAGITNGNGDLDAGKTVTLTASFSENVTVTGAPTLNLNDGAKATYTSGSGKSALTFTYVVAAGQNAADLAVNALALNGGTIKDAAGNNAVLTGAVTSPAGILKIDTTAPTISSVIASGTGITNGNGDLDAGNTVELTVNFSENVTVTGTPVLKLNDGGAASYTGGSGTSALTFAYLVAAGDNTPDLTVTGLVLNGGATITDAAGNNAVLSGAVKNPAGTLKIDSTAPTVTSIVASPSSGEVTTGHLVRITLNTSEAVTLSGVPLLLLNDGGIASYDVAQSTSKAMAFDYTVASGQVTTDLRVSGIQLPSTSSIEDLAGNNANLAGAGADLRLRINTNATGPAGPSGGNFTVSGSTDLELFGASSANVRFAADDTGTLTLHNSQSFAGTVAGLALGNYLDLTDVAYVASKTPGYTPNGANTGGTLSVTDGTHAANIALLGNYMASSFVSSSDGHGGTLITDPPSNQQPLPTHPHA